MIRHHAQSNCIDVWVRHLRRRGQPGRGVSVEAASCGSPGEPTGRCCAVWVRREGTLRRRLRRCVLALPVQRVRQGHCDYSQGVIAKPF